MDFTNRFLLQRGLEITLRSPETAAEILVDLSASYDLCLYEYFLTDLEGHRGSYETAVDLLTELDRFLEAVVQQLNFDNTSLLIVSDHGNIEDMSHGQHTSNPVPTLLWGSIQQVFAPFSLDLRLEQITPLIGKHFGIV
jgi:bisphosphoglycerate-independent phosphoglycerate mutase (AlkP superfamily)